MNPLHPKKLLLSKWTSVLPKNKEKHFLVIKVIEPENLLEVPEWVELEAVMTKSNYRILWRELQNSDVWLQGWK
ncbi:MAG: TIGR02450 family Trp-rich protein [Betaproteobacteria bacterium]